LTWTFFVPTALLTANRQRTQSHHTWGPMNKATRQASCVLARKAKVPRLEQVGIEVQPVQTKGVLADPGAHAPTAKAVIDGLVDAGVLEDDSGKVVAYLQMWAPWKGPEEGIYVSVVPLPEVEHVTYTVGRHI
jgi:hypothetical protein